MFDTHAFIALCNRQSVSDKFIKYFDKQEQLGNILVSAISFWEAALLVKKGRLELEDVELWRIQLFANTGLIFIEPTASEMIKSVQLPDFHRDPFDRLLIAQALNNKATLVTKDRIIKRYSVPTYWI